jgi:hypothetical protein
MYIICFGKTKEIKKGERFNFMYDSYIYLIYLDRVMIRVAFTEIVYLSRLRI